MPRRHDGTAKVKTPAEPHAGNGFAPAAPAAPAGGAAAARAVVPDLDPSFLACGTQFSDRFSYGKSFSPLNIAHEDGETPILPRYQKLLLLGYLSRSPQIFRGLFQKSSGAAKGWMAALLTKNGIDFERFGAAKEAAVEKAPKARKIHQSPASQLLRQGVLQGADSNASLLMNLMKSDIGYLFLDRTRIRPSGIGIGEHVYALSLAPGEEVIIEQKTFSKKQTTFEDENQTEQQTSLELSSTLSTELQEGLQQQSNHSENTGFSAGGSVGGDIDGVDVSLNMGYTDNVSDASAVSSTRSTKNAWNTSRKVASTYRTSHKVTFKVSTEQGFESSSKRIIKNPNKYGPINLHYFKIMQNLELTQERYGVRLCWSPTVKDPAFDLYARIAAGAQKILNPELPAPPTPPQSDKKPQWVKCDPTKVGFFTNGACDMRMDCPVFIVGPDGYVWDGDTSSVVNSFTVNWHGISRSHHAEIKGDPRAEGGNMVHVTVHVGIDWCIWCTCPDSDVPEVVIGANFIPDLSKDPQYQAALAKWNQDMADWQTKVDALKLRAQAEADAWVKEMLADFDPINELLGRIISQNFPPSTRDQAWEIELWQALFDWKNAGFQLYPGWWSDQPARDPLQGPMTFANASWAKIFVPIQVGRELEALRWIYGQTVDTPLDPQLEARFAAIIQDLAQFRSDSFGDPSEMGTGGGDDPFGVQEKVLTLGRWRESMPTDGTHVEIIQSATSAPDRYTHEEINDAALLRDSMIAGERENAKLKQKAVAAKGKTTTQVIIATQKETLDDVATP